MAITGRRVHQPGQHSVWSPQLAPRRFTTSEERTSSRNTAAPALAPEYQGDNP